MNKSSYFIVGKHPVIEALKNNERKVLKIFLTEESKKTIHRESPNKNLLTNVNKMSKYFIGNLNKLQKKYPKLIKEVRGVGLLIGLQLFTDQTIFIKKLMENRLLTIRAAENVIRILPPLNVKKSEIDFALKAINKVCMELE